MQETTTNGECIANSEQKHTCALGYWEANGKYLGIWRTQPIGYNQNHDKQTKLPVWMACKLLSSLWCVRVSVCDDKEQYHETQEI